jgi:tetratricopeptide (TPR) repeat protein
MTAGNQNPSVRLDEALRLARAGQHAEALAEYLWCFDHGSVEQPEFAVTRLSLLLAYLQELGAVYPQAAEALEARRNAAEEAALAGTADLETLETMVALHTRLYSPLRLLDIFGQLGKGGAAQQQTRKRLLPLMLDVLVDRQQYQAIVDNSDDLVADAGRAIGAYLSLADRVAAEEAHTGPSARLALHRRNALETVGNYYEALLGLGRQEQAAQIRDRLLAAVPNDYGSYLVLAGRAMKLHRPEEARLLLERGLQVVSETDQAQLRAALASLPTGEKA